MKESQIQAQVVQYLQYLENAGRLYFIRNNVFTGQIRRRDGSIGYMRQGKSGTSDLIIFLKGGRTIFCELKSEKGKQSFLQMEFERKIKQLGYEYQVIKSIEELEKILK